MAISDTVDVCAQAQTRDDGTKPTQPISERCFGLRDGSDFRDAATGVKPASARRAVGWPQRRAPWRCCAASRLKRHARPGCRAPYRRRVSASGRLRQLCGRIQRAQVPLACCLLCSRTAGRRRRRAGVAVGGFPRPALAWSGLRARFVGVVSSPWRPRAMRASQVSLRRAPPAR
jgi:hypothetical protein